MRILIFILLLFMTPIAAYAAEDPSTTAVIHIEENLKLNNTDKSNVENTFHIILSAADTGCPMPAGSENGQYVFSLGSNESADIEFTFTKVGTYVYSLYEIAPDIKEGFDCDESIYTLVIYVLNSGDDGLVALVAAVNGESKMASIVFKDVYTGKIIPASHDPIKTNNIVKNAAAANVKTGDTSYIMLWRIAFALALSYIAICLVLHRKKSCTD